MFYSDIIVSRVVYMSKFPNVGLFFVFLRVIDLDFSSVIIFDGFLYEGMEAS